MKTTGNIEKGILRRAFASVLPEDVCYRKKSAYPGVQPAYDEAINTWALHILDDSNSAIRPLLDLPVARTMVEDKANSVQSGALLPLAENIIQINEWLDKYHVLLTM